MPLSANSPALDGGGTNALKFLVKFAKIEKWKAYR